MDRKASGNFFISLDFELFWGVRDRRQLSSYGRNIAAVHEVVPQLLHLFAQHGVHATWATVGFLFHRDKEALLAHLPEVRPAYANKALDPYPYLTGQPLEPVYHFAPELIRLIAATPGQEIATHTYAHYYTLEQGADMASFESDLELALSVAREQGYRISSIIFPRNQYSQAHIDSCLRHGITAFRGNEQSWLYETRSRTDETRVRRAARLADTYLNLSGHHTFAVTGDAGCMNIPASRFLRPYSKKLSFLDGLRLRRIRSAMLHAARRGEAYHLWWHPHNFGDHTAENLRFLGRILDYYDELKHRYGMTSQHMQEIRQSQS